MEVDNSLHFLFPEFLSELPDEIFLENEATLNGKSVLPLKDEYFYSLIVVFEITPDLNS